MEFTQVKETCIYIKDLDKSQEFYHGLLGMEVISKVEGRHVFFRAGTSVLLCFIAEATKNETNLPRHYAEGKQHFAFEVTQENYESTKNEMKEKGIPITHLQKWKDQLESFYFEDPDGHVLEIVPKGIWE